MVGAIDLQVFFASDAEEYIGCDPNPNTFKQYLKQIEVYNSFLQNLKKHYIIVMLKICLEDIR